MSVGFLKIDGLVLELKPFVLNNRNGTSGEKPHFSPGGRSVRHHSSGAHTIVSLEDDKTGRIHQNPVMLPSLPYSQTTVSGSIAALRRHADGGLDLNVATRCY